MAEKKNEKTTELKLTPQEYFDQVKERKQKVTDEMLDRVYENCLTLLNKYKITMINFYNRISFVLGYFINLF